MDLSTIAGPVGSLFRVRPQAYQAPLGGLLGGRSATPETYGSHDVSDQPRDDVGRFARTGHPTIDLATGTAGKVDRAHAIYEAAKHYGDLHLAKRVEKGDLIREHMAAALEGATAGELAELAEKMGYFPAPKEKPDKIKAALIERATDRVGARIRSALGGRPEKAKADAEARLKESGFSGAE